MVWHFNKKMLVNLLYLLSFNFPPLGDMDISVFSKYIADMKRVYPAVEGRITFSNSAIFPAHSLGLLLQGLYLSLALWLTSCTALSYIAGCATSG